MSLRQRLPHLTGLLAAVAMIGLIALANEPTPALQTETDRKSQPVSVPANAIDSPDIARELTECATRFLNAIEPDAKAKWFNSKMNFKDAERRNFHFFPIPRRGVPLNALKEGQRQLAYALMSASLSHSGNQKALTIMSLGDYLRETDENPNKFRDSDQFYFTIFGDPAPEGTWSYRVEGFHLSLNVTIVKGRWISVTPSFFGVIPAIVPDGSREGLQVLKNETELGRALAKSLTPQQRTIGFGKIPVFEDTVGGLLTGNERKIERGKPRGLPVTKMSPQQREMLMRLVREHINRIRKELADQDLARIDRAGVKNIHFVWAGGLQSGEPHHYLIQGPTFLIEYDNTQDDANHVHCVYRDFDNDFGDALLKHYHDHHGHSH